MRNIRTKWQSGAFVIGVLVVTLAHAALAHETATVAGMRLTIGWSDEPAFSGLKNSIELDFAERNGDPVKDPNASLSVEVTFGDQRTTLALIPERNRPGKFTASLVPTRPGSYSLHVTGKLKGQFIDMKSTCSAMTFACVTDVSEIQFPAKDPSAGQLAERVSRALPRAERAMNAATSARVSGLAAAAVSVIALVMTFVVGGRRRRAGA